MGKVMRHTLGASLNIRHNLSSSKGPKPLQLKLLTTYIRSEERFSRNAETDLVCRLLLEKKKTKCRAPARGMYSANEAEAPQPCLRHPARTTVRSLERA